MARVASKPGTVLFLCTGNYYRSRFAEHVFNHLADECGLNWRAVSRGLSCDGGPWKVGPISVYALKALEARGIRCRTPHREPVLCVEEDILSADIVIALKESEHRPWVERRFPHLLRRVQFWQIHDINVAKSEDALGQLESLLREFVKELTSSDSGNS